jgi:hypothetical protein
MPPFGQSYSNTEVAAVANYVTARREAVGNYCGRSREAARASVRLRHFVLSHSREGVPAWTERDLAGPRPE